MKKQILQRHHASIQRAMIAFAFVVVLFWTINVVSWALTGVMPGWLLIVYPLIAIGGGVTFYLVLPRHARGTGRKILLLLIGTFLVGIAYASGRGNMQIEGLFFGLLTGIGLPVVLHYAIGKVFGPLVFGRIWCGWACWYSMVFDLLPYKSGDRTIGQRWTRLRYVHFFGSLALVLALWYGVGYRGGALGETGQHWFLIGLFLYHAIGIIMAIALRDNRAFCKYLCPVAVPLKATSRYALLKVQGDPLACAACAKRTCITVCPMNVRIPDYVTQGKRVLSTECILCQECINTCPDNALRLSFGFDVGGEELLAHSVPRR